MRLKIDKKCEQLALTENLVVLTKKGIVCCLALVATKPLQYEILSKLNWVDIEKKVYNLLVNINNHIIFSYFVATKIKLWTIQCLHP